MQDFPHHYIVAASAEGKNNVVIAAEGLPDIESAGPPQFGGPGGVWSPEELLVAAVADCFILSFRAIARTARLEWSTLECRVDGALDKIDKFTQFTGFTVHATLTIPDEKDRRKAGVILEKADKYCLVSNSLKADSELTTEVVVSA
jgi:organic hydroperoxide reductase OsmC/OhrA